MNDSPKAQYVTDENGRLTSLPDPIRAGCEFQGWYTEATGGEQVTTSTVFTGDATIYAQWTQDSEPEPPPPTGGRIFTITVEDAEGGSVQSSHTKAPSSRTITLTVTPDKGFALASLAVTTTEGEKVGLTSKGGGVYTFKMPASDVTVTAEFEAEFESGWNRGYHGCPRDHTCPIWPYTDAETTAWYHDGVHFCLENGLMIGYGNNIFQPDSSTTRAMVTVMLWRLNGSPVVNYALDFEDVPADAWYTEAVRWARSEGVVEGYGDGRFGPDDAVTREQMVTILWRYARYMGYDVSVGENTNILSYLDAFDVSEYAVPAMQWACGSGMVVGREDESGGMILDPKGSTTRAQMATMMMRFCVEIVK